MFRGNSPLNDQCWELILVSYSLFIVPSGLLYEKQDAGLYDHWSDLAGLCFFSKMLFVPSLPYWCIQVIIYKWTRLMNMGRKRWIRNARLYMDPF